MTLETLRISALLLSPVIPRASAVLLDALGVVEATESGGAFATAALVSGAPPAGTALLLPGPGRRMVLFPRRET